MEYGTTAYNKQYALRRRQAAARGSKNRSRRKRLCAVLSHPHSSPPQTYGLLYKVDWNVAYLERYAKWKAKFYWKIM